MARTRQTLKPTEAVKAELPRPAKEERAKKQAKVKEVISDEDVLRKLKKKTLDKRAAVAVKDAVLKPKRGSLKPQPARQTRQKKSTEEAEAKKPAVKRVRRKASA